MKIERATKMKMVKDNLLAKTNRTFGKTNSNKRTKERMLVTLDKILA